MPSSARWRRTYDGAAAGIRAVRERAAQNPAASCGSLRSRPRENRDDAGRLFDCTGPKRREGDSPNSRGRKSRCRDTAPDSVSGGVRAPIAWQIQRKRYVNPNIAESDWTQEAMKFGAINRLRIIARAATSNTK